MLVVNLCTVHDKLGLDASTCNDNLQIDSDLYFITYKDYENPQLAIKRHWMKCLRCSVETVLEHYSPR